MTFSNSAPVQNNLGGRTVAPDRARVDLSMPSTDLREVRALAPDISRGVMLLFIAVANVSLYLWGHPGDGITGHPTDGTVLDRVLAAFAMVFVDGRIYPMFAFLFGYGIVQFTMSRWNRGIGIVPIRRMLMRRHLWLIAFGFVHALLLFSGDVLGSYGLAGLILTAIFLTRSDRAVKTTAWVLASLLAAGTLLALGLGALVETFAGGFDFSGATEVETSSGDGSLLDLLVSGTGAVFVAGISDFWIAMLVRVGTWVMSAPGALLMLAVPLCVLLGILAARHRWLEGGATRVSLRVVAWFGVSIAVCAGIPSALSYLGIVHIGGVLASVLLAVSHFAGVLGGIGFAALFALLALRISAPLNTAPLNTAPLNTVWVAIAAVGKRSLTFYLLQSVIFAPLLSAWGFGLGSQLNTAGAFALAFGVWVLSLVLAYLLEQRNARGPAEKLLRRLTYGSLDASDTPQRAHSGI